MDREQDIMAASKQRARAEALSRRDSISQEKRSELDLRILALLSGLPDFMTARGVLIYASFRSEAGTGAIIERALSEGKQVTLPKVDKANNRLTMHAISGMQDVRPGFMGIPEPATDTPVRPEDADIVIVPGVAFSPAGARIGYGGGYYDRLLPGLKGVRPIIALAYEEQIFPSLPSERHDVSMDMIITPERILYCNENQ